jgi:TonB family protein
MLVAPLLVVLALPSPQQPPRDPAVRPGIVLDATTREAELARRIAASPNNITAYQELAKLQEDRGAGADAEATLLKARQIAPRHKGLLMTLSGFYNRTGNFEKTMEALEAAERVDLTDPMMPQMVATYYWEKAFKDQRLPESDKLRYITSGIAATDRALALKPDFVEALTYKNILLRMQANLESTDPFQKQQLIAEADALRNRAIELNKNRATPAAGNPNMMPGVAPPPPPYPAPMAPVRVGGNIKTPMKTKDVRPVYPPDAMAAGITGVVIIEAVIDPEGRVGDAKVLRSIPALDQAAVDAVRQWEFVPTLLNGAPVPVIMTVTVNFTLQ